MGLLYSASTENDYMGSCILTAWWADKLTHCRGILMYLTTLHQLQHLLVFKWYERKDWGESGYAIFEDTRYFSWWTMETMEHLSYGIHYPCRSSNRATSEALAPKLTCSVAAGREDWNRFSCERYTTSLTSQLLIIIHV